MDKITITNIQIIGFGDNYNRNYGNNLFQLFLEEENIESIYFSQNEYNNPVCFSVELNEKVFSEEEILSKEIFNLMGYYKHKKIFFNNRDVEVAFVLDSNNKISFLAYSYDEIYANVIYPQNKDAIIMDNEKKLATYIEYLYS